jgi:FADH2 O2-dependent halogenase
MTPDADLAIIGSGFGGALLAMVVRRLGRRVLLLERGRHPRFAIGESASPLAGVVLESLAERYDLPRLAPLASYGAWRRTYPEVTCGLKRGFTFFRHDLDERFRRAPDRSTELLVAASPSDELSDTHWLRADVDHFLVREAVDLGVEYLDEVHLDGFAWEPSGLAALSGTRAGRRLCVRVGSVVDASGPNGFLARVLALESPGFAGYPGTQALFSHFSGVARCEDMPEYGATARVLGCGGAGVRGCGGAEPPYPVDAAALHHVFDEGWMWVLRFGNGLTSAGVAVTDRLAADLRLSDGEAAWRRLLARYPSIAAQFADAEPVREFTWMPRVAYRVSAAAGPRWALLPSAAAFVDPLFSTGIPLTLLGIERLAHLVDTGRLESGGAAHGEAAGVESAAGYSRATLAEADHTASFVAGCYAAFPRFADFTAYAMFYFVAASFSEMARRLGGRPPGFLCAGDDGFAAALEDLSPALARHDDLAARVAAATERFNVAGLCDPAKRHWYGVDPEDTIRAAAKLGSTPDRVRALFDVIGGPEDPVTDVH